MNPSIVSKASLSFFEKKLLSIINEGILLSKPLNIMKKHIRKVSKRCFKIKNHTVDLSNGKLYILGWGKAAGAMAEAIESILGTDMIEEGIVVSTSGEHKLKKIKLFKGSHPFPSKKNIKAAEHVVSLAKKCNENDYVICLVSGGGSSLLCLPVPEISLDEKIRVTKTMIMSGIGSEKVNAVRKHLSSIKGGKLAGLIYPAAITNLVISDNIHNTLNGIASGATVPDTTTFADVLEIIDNHGLSDKLPANVVDYIRSNQGSTEQETLKKGDAVFDRTTSIILYDNRALLENLKEKANKKGFSKVEIYPVTLHGDINKAVHEFCSFIEEAGNSADSEFLVLAGGELEVKAGSEGKGGRAQHFAALMTPQLQNFKNSAFAAVASDGNDFIDGIAGALVTDKTMNHIVRKKIDYKAYIQKTNTFDLHDKLKTHLFTVKPTQTNVVDIYVFGREASKGA